jgi:hypothetical protein
MQYTVQLHTKHWVEAVLRIRDIFVRIWIRGSIPLTDSDPAIFVSDLQDPTKSFMLVHIHHFSKIKSHKEQGFFPHFCLMLEGSGSEPLTNGSGSGRPKNIWIISIRNHNTG